jgi:hypothetical protein
MLRIAFVIVIAANVATGFSSMGMQARAQPQTQLNTTGPSDSARYTFFRYRDTFLRLEVSTGHVSECGWEASGWFCRVLPDERLALESEIARLQESNLALKKALLARGLPLPNGLAADPPEPERPDGLIKMPSGADLTRVKMALENLWHRMVGMMANLQRDMLRKS